MNVGDTGGFLMTLRVDVITDPTNLLNSLKGEFHYLCCKTLVLFLEILCVFHVKTMNSAWESLGTVSKLGPHSFL